MKFFTKDICTGNVMQFGKFVWSIKSRNWFFAAKDNCRFGPESLRCIQLQLESLREEFPNGPNNQPDYDLAS
jgi:hypothetical protein